MIAYKTIVALSAWRYDTSGEATGDPSGQSQTYCDPDDEDEIDGWSIRLEHRAVEDGPDGLHEDDLCDPEGAPDLDVDVGDYAAAYLIADALACKMGWELREY